jgi:hypothetical protein
MKLLLILIFLSLIGLLDSFISTSKCSSLSKNYKKFNLLSEVNTENEDQSALPVYIQDLNKFAVETVKSILSTIYGDRHYARYFL